LGKPCIGLRDLAYVTGSTHSETERMHGKMRPWLRDKLRLKAIMKSCLLNIKAAAFSPPGQTCFVLNE